MEMDKVIVAFESPKSCERVREIIESSGTAACIICRSAAEVKRTVSKHHISTVVCGFKLPDESAQSLFEDLPPNCAMLMVRSRECWICARTTIFSYWPLQ